MVDVIRRRSIMLAALATLLFLAGAPAGADSGQEGRMPDLGDGRNLQVEAGNTVAAWAYAEGVQIYRWNGTNWAFQKPEAILYSGDGDEDGVVGTHYAGPTWESNSGSKVVGEFRDRYAPDADSIPWLLLKATSSEGPGILHRVTFIQRLYTVGGVAPAAPGEFVGDEARVPYSAWYVFYRAQ